MNIRAVPLTYRGITFRSSLEADWAATLDELGIYWQYEPIALQLPSGQQYLPDFHLPAINTWAEVKGPHWERMDKAVEFRRMLKTGGIGWWQEAHVIVLEAPGPGDAASWRVPESDRTVYLTRCGHRDSNWTWSERDGSCWRCYSSNCAVGQWYWPASEVGPDEQFRTYQMARAPRPEIVNSKKGGN